MMAKTLTTLAAANAAIPLMTCASLVLFAGVFLGTLLWISRRGSREHYQALGRMPLGDE